MLLLSPLYGLDASLEKAAKTTPVTGTRPISASSEAQVLPSTGHTKPPLGKLKSEPEVAISPPYKVPTDTVSLLHG